MRFDDTKEEERQPSTVGVTLKPRVSRVAESTLKYVHCAVSKVWLPWVSIDLLSRVMSHAQILFNLYVVVIRTKPLNNYNNNILYRIEFTRQTLGIISSYKSTFI